MQAAKENKIAGAIQKQVRKGTKGKGKAKVTSTDEAKGRAHRSCSPSFDIDTMDLDEKAPSNSPPPKSNSVIALTASMFANAANWTQSLVSKRKNLAPPPSPQPTEQKAMQIAGSAPSSPPPAPEQNLSQGRCPANPPRPVQQEQPKVAPPQQNFSPPCPAQPRVSMSCSSPSC